MAMAGALYSVAAEPRSEISTSDALATVSQGQIAGYTENGIYIYKGIPYAKAKRFMAPEKADPWQGCAAAATMVRHVRKLSGRVGRTMRSPSLSTGMTDTPEKTVSVQMYGRLPKALTAADAL